MTVYELVRNLVEYPPEVEISLYVGSLSASDCTFELKKYFYEGKEHPELHIILQ